MVYESRAGKTPLINPSRKEAVQSRRICIPIIAVSGLSRGELPGQNVTPCMSSGKGTKAKEGLCKGGGRAAGGERAEIH